MALRTKTKFESSWVLKTGMVKGQEDLFQIREKLQKDGPSYLNERICPSI